MNNGSINDILDIEGELSLVGPKGDKGYSPSAVVESITGGATITITDEDGTTTATIYDGQTGPDGYSPSASVSKVGTTSTITITDKNGTTTASVNDGEDGATGNGIASITKTGTSGLVDTYTILYTDGNSTTFTVTNGETQDLTDYVKNTDYANSSVGGVIKVTPTTYLIEVASGNLRGTVVTYSAYDSANDKALISKGTLENVITGKDLTTKTYVDGLVGDINTALDTINGEVI